MEEKYTKREVNYGEGIPQRRCALCTMFREPRSCTAVQGVILPDDVCDIFDRKRGERG
jgi:hypothetical protein